MTQIIEQLTARVRELEEEIERKMSAGQYVLEQLAASQAYAEQLRVAIEQYLAENDLSEFGCDCVPSVGHLCGPCFAHKQQTVLRKALTLPHDTSALDAYVAEKVKIARDIDEKQIAYLFEERSLLTQKRDLAVEWLECCAVHVRPTATIFYKEILEALSTIKESEAMAQGEKK